MPGREYEIIKCLAFSPDGKTSFPAGSPGWSEATTSAGLRLWDAVTGAERASFTTQRQWVLGLSFSQTANFSRRRTEGSIVVRDARDEGAGERIVLYGATRRFPQFHEPLFSPDGKTLASVDRGSATLEPWIDLKVQN